MTSERWLLLEHLRADTPFETAVPKVSGDAALPNRAGEARLGLFRPPGAAKAVIADVEMLKAFREGNREPPGFLEAGPRERLRFNPSQVRAAVVTTGGVAPGLHSVIHSIVKRHCNAYSIDMGKGHIFGVDDSFRGLCDLANHTQELKPSITEEWLDQGGSNLGSVRYFHDAGKDGLVAQITENLTNNQIDILYVLGGDGSLEIAHRIAQVNPTRSIVGIPKTMDNDVLWVELSFGFDTAVEQATRVINTLSAEAKSTHRIALVKLFGAESGFVAANAALASGHVDLVLIPEVFKALDEDQAEAYLDAVVDHVKQVVRSEQRNPHAVIVIAEGVETVFLAKPESGPLDGTAVEKGRFMSHLAEALKSICDAHGHPMEVFENEPRHYIRSVPANAHDQIYCERLGALAVDNALAGYTDFMISHWLTEFVLVPLSLVQLGKKSITMNSMFWKQVVSSTGQPLSPAEDLHP
jgi:6-phosphofructokinase 1